MYTRICFVFEKSQKPTSPYQPPGSRSAYCYRALSCYTTRSGGASAKQRSAKTANNSGANNFGGRETAVYGRNTGHRTSKLSLSAKTDVAGAGCLVVRARWCVMATVLWCMVRERVAHDGRAWCMARRIKSATARTASGRISAAVCRGGQWRLFTRGMIARKRCVGSAQWRTGKLLNSFSICFIM